MARKQTKLRELTPLKIRPSTSISRCNFTVHPTPASPENVKAIEALAKAAEANAYAIQQAARSLCGVMPNALIQVEASGE
jgi:hypothetical protein